MGHEVLAHEFQHMIQYNQKYKKHGKQSPSWYTEMLSKVAEEVVEFVLGSEGTQVYAFVPRFLGAYTQEGITEWTRGGLSDSYGKVWTFGMYLTLNYGGFGFLQKLLANDSVGIESVSAALHETAPGMDFSKALAQFGEALLFGGTSKPEGARTFEHSISQTLNSIDYSLQGFDIWHFTNDADYKGHGPQIFPLTPTEMRPYSLVIQSSDDWQDKTGDYSVTLQKPASDDVELYIMVR
jgi:hypothetical protein